MADQLYHRLRERLDQYAVGFPISESGTEMAILRNLFSPEEAELFLCLQLKPEPVETISDRTNLDAAHLTRRLSRMMDKGLIYRREKDHQLQFGALPFAPGIFEQQSHTMDEALAALFDDYFEEVFHKNFTDTSPVLIHRSIPIHRTIDIAYPMPMYERSREIVRNQKRIAVTPCICRVQKGALDKGCGKPLETCLMFGSQARFYMDRGTGREISIEAALDILDQCEDAGLVTMPFNSQTPANICNCCPDCCIVLSALNRHPRPAEMMKPTFYAVTDHRLCEGCGTCTERCPTAAVTLTSDEVAQVNPDRCIGCGLCVVSCPTDAVRLEPRPADKRLDPPETTVKTFMEIHQRRRDPNPAGV